MVRPFPGHFNSLNELESEASGTRRARRECCTLISICKAYLITEIAPWECCRVSYMWLCMWEVDYPLPVRQNPSDLICLTLKEPGRSPKIPLSGSRFDFGSKLGKLTGRYRLVRGRGRGKHGSNEKLSLEMLRQWQEQRDGRKLPQT